MPGCRQATVAFSNSGVHAANFHLKRTHPQHTSCATNCVVRLGTYGATNMWHLVAQQRKLTRLGALCGGWSGYGAGLGKAVQQLILVFAYHLTRRKTSIMLIVFSSSRRHARVAQLFSHCRLAPVLCSCNKHIVSSTLEVQLYPTSIRGPHSAYICDDVCFLYRRKS